MRGRLARLLWFNRLRTSCLGLLVVLFLLLYRLLTQARRPGGALAIQNPTTDTRAESTRVGMRVASEDGGFLAGVEDFNSRFSFLILYDGVDN